MNIYITKPNGSGYWPVQTDASTTAQKCVDELIQHGGLSPGGDYRLFYQGREILPQESFQEVGITDECTIAMQELQQGALAEFAGGLDIARHLAD